MNAPLLLDDGALAGLFGLAVQVVIDVFHGNAVGIEREGGDVSGSDAVDIDVACRAAVEACHIFSSAIIDRKIGEPDLGGAQMAVETFDDRNFHEPALESGGFRFFGLDSLAGLFQPVELGFMFFECGLGHVAGLVQLSQPVFRSVEFRLQLLQLELHQVDARLRRIELILPGLELFSQRPVTNLQVEIGPHGVALGPLKFHLAGELLVLPVQMIGFFLGRFQFVLPISDRLFRRLVAGVELALFLFKLRGRQSRQVIVKLLRLKFVGHALNAAPFVGIVGLHHPHRRCEKRQGARRRNDVHLSQVSPDIFCCGHDFFR